MGKKWGSNEDIRIGDIFDCIVSENLWARPEYYQVVALRGRTQVILHAGRSETYINEGISEDSSLHWHRKRTRPLPGQFMTEDEMWVIVEYQRRGKTIRITGEKVTAWVSPDRSPDGSPILLEVGELPRRWGIYYRLAQPKDWEPWDAEMIQKLEEYRRQENEAIVRQWKGETDVPWPEYPL